MKKRVCLFQILFLFAALSFSFGLSQAQIHVASDGDVGVGATAPLAKLHVRRTANTSTYTAYFHNSATTSSTKNGLYNYVTNAGTGTRYGMRNYTYSLASNSNSSYGLYNRTLGSKGVSYGHYNYTLQPAGATGQGRGIYNYYNTQTSSTGYGLYNYTYTAAGGSGTRYGGYFRTLNYGPGTTYGLYSTVGGSGTGTKWAGYFNGNVHVVGNLTWTSDARKKENVQGISNALGVLASLEPKSYTFKEEANMNLPAGEQFGFMAQDLEKTLPSLVTTVEQPAEPQGDTGVMEGEEIEETATEEMQGEEFKSINYVALIPILVQAVNDQQAEIEAQKQEIAALRKLLEEK